MAKYHISPKTGAPGVCRASVKPCPVGGAVTYDSATYRFLHEGGSGKCPPEAAKAYSGGEPGLVPTVNMHCSYCGTGDPAHGSFTQKAYSDERSCSRCGGVSGYGIGD